MLPFSNNKGGLAVNEWKGKPNQGEWANARRGEAVSMARVRNSCTTRRIASLSS